MDNGQRDADINLDAPPPVQAAAGSAGNGAVSEQTQQQMIIAALRDKLADVITELAIAEYNLKQMASQLEIARERADRLSTVVADNTAVKE